MSKSTTILSIDIETYSGKDLAKCGVYSYVEDNDFEILLFGYAFGEEDVSVVDLKNGEPMPEEVMKALVDSEVIKTAFNANFERTCLRKYFNMDMPPEQWRCTQVLAMCLGLPSSLEHAAKVLGIKEQKLEEGKRLIRYFSTSRASLLRDDKESWESFKSYCKRDVEVERSLRKKLGKYKLNDSEQRLWVLDQKINDLGVKVDRELIRNAMECDVRNSDRIKGEIISLIGVKNPNSTAQIKNWIFNKEGISISSLCKEKVEELLEQDISKEAKEVLKLRQQLSKTSVKKYEVMDRALCQDGRIRGMLQFYGANRTGRWAGKLVQVHNLPQTKMQELEEARNLLKAGTYKVMPNKFDSISEVLSQLVRTAFVPEEGSRFIVVDFSAIEARIISWLAGQFWRMEVFKSHGMIYEASAARMFGVPMEEITKDSQLRQKGKIAELALGYQGSKGALVNMGALKMGLKEEELLGLVEAWRDSNSKIVRLWHDVEEAAIAAVWDRKSVQLEHGLEFSLEGGILFIKLPSGRRLSYINPRLEPDFNYKKYRLSYEGMDQTSKQWTRLDTYGGKLVENIVQAIARDCLAEAMLNLHMAGYKITFHVHDEVILEVPFSFGSIEEVLRILSKEPSWAKGLPLRAEGFEARYYRK